MSHLFLHFDGPDAEKLVEGIVENFKKNRPDTQLEVDGTTLIFMGDDAEECMELLTALAVKHGMAVGAMGTEEGEA